MWNGNGIWVGLVCWVSFGLISLQAGPSDCGNTEAWYSSLSEKKLTASWNRPVQGTPDEKPEAAPESDGPIEFYLSDRTVTSDFNDYLDIEISGLSLGQTVLLEKYLLEIGQTEITDNARLVDCRLITDGYLPLTGGEVNYNELLDYIEIDLEAVTYLDGEIVSYFPVRSGFEIIPGNYIYRVSSPLNSFEPVTQPFTVRETPTNQYYEGRVLEGETPIPGAFVGLLEPVSDHVQVIQITVADENGNYQLYAPYEGEFLLAAVAPGYVAELGVGAGEYLWLDEWLEVDLQMTPATRKLEGKLVDSVSGEPLAGIPVTFIDQDGVGASEGRSLFTHTWTNAQGEYSVMTTPGSWGLVFKMTDLTSRSYLANATAPIAVFDLTEGDVTDVVTPLVKGTCMITGTLASADFVDPWGDPLPLEGVEIMAINYEAGLAASGYTYEDGWFNIAVSPGRWDVFPFSYDLELTEHSGSFSQAVYFSDHDQSINVDFNVRPMNGVVYGVAQTSEGDSIPNLLVAAFGTEHNNLEMVLQSTFESDGYYNFYLASGSWIFFPNAEESAKRQLMYKNLPTITIPETGDPWDDNVIEQNMESVPYDSKIQMTLVNESGAPVPGIKMHAFTTTEDGTVYDSFGMTDEEGVALMPALAGDWKVHFSITNLRDAGYLEVDLLEVSVNEELVSSQYQLESFGSVAASLTPQIIEDAEYRFYMEGRGEPGRRYLIEGSQDLATWEPLGQVTAVEGKFEILDDPDRQPNNGSTVYYRAIPQ